MSPGFLTSLDLESPGAKRGAAAGSDPKAKRTAVVALPDDMDSDELFLPACQRVDLAGTTILDIRFSQNNVQKCASDGQTLLKLQNALKKNGWDKALMPLTVVRNQDGTLTSLDNRRLLCAKRIVRGGDNFTVPCMIYAHDQPADKKYLTAIAGLWSGNKPRLAEINTLAEASDLGLDSWGWCVLARSNGHISGFAEDPKVRADIKCCKVGKKNTLTPLGNREFLALQSYRCLPHQINMFNVRG